MMHYTYSLSIVVTPITVRYETHFRILSAQVCDIPFWTPQDIWSSYQCLVNSYNSVRQSKIAKVATKNRQNRHLAEFRQTSLPKVVEDQILIGKMVSHRSFRSPSQKLGPFGFT